MDRREFLGAVGGLAVAASLPAAVPAEDIFDHPLAVTAGDNGWPASRHTRYAREIDEAIVLTPPGRLWGVGLARVLVGYSPAPRVTLIPLQGQGTHLRLSRPEYIEKANHHWQIIRQHPELTLTYYRHAKPEGIVHQRLSGIRWLSNTELTFDVMENIPRLDALPSGVGWSTPNAFTFEGVLHSPCDHIEINLIV